MSCYRHLAESAFMTQFICSSGKNINFDLVLGTFSSPASALTLSNIEEGMGHNAERDQELQEELAQRRASLHQDSAEAQTLQRKEALLATIIEEEMAHWTQVLVLSHLHLQQAKEIRSQSDEIRHLSTLLEKQQAILEQVQEKQRRMPEMHSFCNVD